MLVRCVYRLLLDYWLSSLQQQVSLQLWTGLHEYTWTYSIVTPAEIYKPGIRQAVCPLNWEYIPRNNYAPCGTVLLSEADRKYSPEQLVRDNDPTSYRYQHVTYIMSADSEVCGGVMVCSRMPADSYSSSSSSKPKLHLADLSKTYLRHARYGQIRVCTCH